MNPPATERWNQLWRQAAPRGDAARTFGELQSLYAQRHRHYHNLQHISECLLEFDQAKPLAGAPVAVELGIWFHDAVYDPHAADNEERSAELARRRLAEGGGTETLLASVGALILATKTHDAALHPDAPLMVDIDLSILGQPEKRFWEYEEQIRREYKWVPKAIFAPKRAEILRRFLARERIYSTTPFFSLYEQAARANLGASIRKLGG